MSALACSLTHISDPVIAPITRAAKFTVRPNTLDRHRTDVDTGADLQFRRTRKFRPTRIAVQRAGIVKRVVDRVKGDHYAVADCLDLVTPVSGDQFAALGKMGGAQRAHTLVLEAFPERRRADDVGEDNRQGDAIAAGPAHKAFRAGLRAGRAHKIVDVS